MGNVVIAPDADDTDGNWTTQVGGTSLFAVIDEASADDADYIKSGPNPAADTCKIRLSNPAQPMLDPMKVSVRYRKQVSTQKVDLTIRLVEGTTTRAEWTVSDIADTWTTATNTLSEAERAAITDFTNLYVELEAALGGGDLLLDTYPDAAFAYSLRQLRTAYTGPVVRVRESIGNTESDFTAAELTPGGIGEFIGLGTGFIVQWYDQTGNGLHQVQAVAGLQPAYSASGILSLPTIYFAGDRYLGGSFDLSLYMSSQGTIMMVMQQTGTDARSTPMAWQPSSSANRCVIHATYDDVIYFDLGNATAGEGRVSVAQPVGWDDNPHVLEAYRDASDNQNITVDGNSLVTVECTQDIASETGVLYTGCVLTGDILTGYISELVCWGTDLGSTDRPAARAAINTYYSVF